MTSGWTMLGLATLICIGLFANGLRFARLGSPLPHGNPAEIKRRMIGMLFMTTAPLFWLLFASFCFGLFGPVRNIQTIQLH
jgi:hypothetical protein